MFANKLNSKVIHYHKPGQKAKKLILNFPWWLWEPVNWWWSRLRWTPKSDHKNIGASNAGKAKKKVTWLELVIDFELTTGLRCQEDRTEERSWEEKATLLKKIIRSLVNTRGTEKEATLPKCMETIGKSTRSEDLAQKQAEGSIEDRDS